MLFVGSIDQFGTETPRGGVAEGVAETDLASATRFRGKIGGSEGRHGWGRRGTPPPILGFARVGTRDRTPLPRVGQI